MKKILVTAFLLISIILTGCNTFNKSQKIVVGLDDEYAPMGFRNEKNEIVGFDIDLAKEAASRMGTKFEFVSIDWDKKFEELDSGRIDIIWNGLNITPERKDIILFSKPYMDNRQILLVKKDSDLEIYSEYDLADKIVGVRAGSTSESYVLRNEKLKDSFKELKSFPTFQKAYNDLVNNEYDVLIIDELPGRYEMIKHIDEVKAIEVTVGPVTQIGIGFRKNDMELRDNVQRVLDEMIKDGTAAKISETWFQADLIKSKG